MSTRRISTVAHVGHLDIGGQNPIRIQSMATVGVNAAQNAALLACQMLALSDEDLARRMAEHKDGLKEKIEKANRELADVKFEYKTN